MLTYDHTTTGSDYAAPAMPFESRIAQMKVQDVATFISNPAPDQGPVFLVFDVHGTHPGAEADEVFAAAAVLTQRGRTLATFQGLALKEFKIHSDFLKHMPERVAELEKHVKVKDNCTLNIAFGDFVVWCWKAVWTAFRDHLTSEHGSVIHRDLLKAGLFQVVHNGLCPDMEESFFHRTVPPDYVVKEAMGEDIIAALHHPYYIQKLSSIMTGLGYSPFIVDSDAYKAIDADSKYADVFGSAKGMAALLWAGHERSPKLESYFIKGW